MTFPPHTPSIYIYIYEIPAYQDSSGLSYHPQPGNPRQDLVQILKVEPGETLSSDSLAVGGFLANMTDGIHGTKKGWYIYPNMKTHKNQL